MLQLKEALDQRMGCVIVGPSGCGKSTLWSVLRQAMVSCGQAVNTHVVNPKSMPRQVMKGFVVVVIVFVFVVTVGYYRPIKVVNAKNKM